MCPIEHTARGHLDRFEQGRRRRAVVAERNLQDGHVPERVEQRGPVPRAQDGLARDPVDDLHRELVDHGRCEEGTHVFYEGQDLVCARWRQDALPGDVDREPRVVPRRAADDERGSLGFE